MDGMHFSIKKTIDSIMKQPQLDLDRYDLTKEILLRLNTSRG